MIKIRQISKSFSIRGKEKNILDRLTFNIPEHSFTTIFGPNGCGKTTLLNILSGIDENYSGKIEGIEKNKIGYVFQDYRRSLLPWKNVEENILFPLNLLNFTQKAKKARLEKLLDTIKIDFDLSQPVFSLSGGQAQLACIMRALIIEPKILILDEPFAALDYEKTLFLRQLISDLAKLMNLTVIFISHDLEEAMFLGDQIVFLSKHPTKVVEILEVTLPYPRNSELTTTTNFNILRQKSIEIFQKCIAAG